MNESTLKRNVPESQAASGSYKPQCTPKSLFYISRPLFYSPFCNPYRSLLEEPYSSYSKALIGFRA